MPHTNPTLSRRSVLASTSAVAVASLVAGLETAAATGKSQVIAFVTDTHADPENQLHLDRLAATMRAIEADAPLFVLNGGDVTEYGTAATFDSYFERVPASLKDAMLHTPGNHESRWDPSAYEVYEQYFGERNVSVTVGGVQVISIDATMPQQELAFYTDEDLAWLDRELRKKRGNQPTILMVHFPQGEGHYYTVNQEAFLDVIEGRGVSLMLTGHIHQLAVDNFNGVTHVHSGANRTLAQYLRVILGGKGEPLMTLEHVAIPNPAAWETQTVTHLGTVERGAEKVAARLKPRSLSVRVSRSTLNVSLVAPHARQDATVKAAVYHQGNYGGVTADVWHPLSQRGKRWTGSIDVSTLAPGEHRLRVNVEQDGVRWREIVPFTVEDSAFRQTDDDAIDGLIHGGLAALGNRVFVPSSDGAVIAYDLRRGRLSKAWRRRTGPIWTCLDLDPDHGLVIAASSDHFVRAIEADSGRIAWERDLGLPVMSDPLVARAGDDTLVVVTAGHEVSVIDAATGDVRWTRELPDMSAGRAALDSERVYLGVGDGRAWALNLADGEPAWSRELSDRVDAYRRRIYGPWNNHATLVGDDLVIISTVAKANALNRATGETVWTLPQSYLYTPIRQIEGGDLIMVDEWGVMRRVDPATGTARWVAEAVVPRSLEAAPVIVGDRIHLVGVTGMLGVVDAASGEVLGRRQLMANNVFSTPAAVNGSLVVGHMPGVVRAYPLG